MPATTVAAATTAVEAAATATVESTAAAAVESTATAMEASATETAGREAPAGRSGAESATAERRAGPISGRTPECSRAAPISRRRIRRG